MLGALEIKAIRRLVRLHGKEWKTIHTAVMSCLLSHHNRKTGHCWPERKVVAEYCNVSVRTVDRTLKRLTDWSVIERQQPRALSSQRFRNVQYTFCFELPRSPCDKAVTQSPCDKNANRRATKTPIAVRQSCDDRNKEEGKVLMQEKDQNQPPEADANSLSVSQGQIREIAALYPLVDDPFHLTPELWTQIYYAIRRDGRDRVWAGTKSMAEVVKEWPRSQWYFLPAPARYFRESQYRRDPQFWRRETNGRKPVTAEYIKRVREETRAILRRRAERAHTP